MRNLRKSAVLMGLPLLLAAGCGDDGGGGTSTGTSGATGTATSSTSDATSTSSGGGMGGMGGMGEGGGGGTGEGGMGVGGAGGATGGGGSGGSIPDCSDNAQCDDGDGCTTDACDMGTCKHTLVDTSDGDACTSDACDPATGTLSHTPIDPDDGFACTADACDSVTGVSHVPSDALCDVGEVCNVQFGCIGNDLSNVVITELGVLGSEFIELHNPTAKAGTVTGFVLMNAAGQTVKLFAATDPTGVLGDPAVLTAGQFGYGVPNPADPAQIPLDATFVYGDPGTAFNFADTGDKLTLSDSANNVLDVLDFATMLVGNIPAFHTDPNTPIVGGQFPGLLGKSTQLDPNFLFANNNDLGDYWCTTFRAADTRGAPNGSCSDFVINEVLYDYDHPTTGTDDKETFVEIAGPGGGDLSDVHLLGIDGDGAGNQEPNTTFAMGTRMPVDGFFVVADAVGGVTNVPGADLLASCDPTNGSGNGDAIQLFDAAGALIDQVGYGQATVAKEGTAVIDIDLDKVGISIARDATSGDSDDNIIDFHYDPTPTPGAANLPVSPQILSVSLKDGLASTTTVVTLKVLDFADLDKVDGTAPADNDVNATFGPNATVDTTSLSDGCTFVSIDDSGRGPATITCTAPTNAGVVVRGDFVLQNPAFLGGSVTITNGWTYTGVNNGLGGAAEVDYCNVQFPFTMTAQQGTATAVVYGQIYEAGVTEPAGADPGILAQLGYGTLASNPTMTSGWAFFDAGYNLNVGNNDEYMLSLTAPAVTVQTDFSYAYRFSYDDGLTFTYCDTDGSGSNLGAASFSSAALGVLTVTP